MDDDHNDDDDNNVAVVDVADNNKPSIRTTVATATKPAPKTTMPTKQPPSNILLRVLQRERTGFLNANIRLRSNQQRLAAVPQGLSFCLQDIVPYCYLTG